MYNIYRCNDVSKRYYQVPVLSEYPFQLLTLTPGNGSLRISPVTKKRAKAHSFRPLA